jgi:hypothetical protein
MKSASRIGVPPFCTLSSLPIVRAGHTRTEEVKKFLVLESLGQSAQRLSNSGVSRLDKLYPCQQLVQVRRDHRFTHRVDKVFWPAREGFGGKLSGCLLT